MPETPDHSEIIRSIAPPTVAVALETDFKRQGRAKLPTTTTSQTQELTETTVQAAATSFTERDPHAFMDAMERVSSLDTGRNESLGVELAKAFGPLMDSDREGTATFLQQVVPPQVWAKAMKMADEIRSGYAQKAKKDEARIKQEELVREHMALKEEARLHPAVEHFGPDPSIYAILQMPSGHDGWEREGVKTEILFPGYGFGAHQSIVGSYDKHFAVGCTEEDLEPWAEKFIKNSEQTWTG